MDWETVLEELYELSPADFTATRDAHARQARADGDRELSGRIAGLRKPPTAAWAVNLLVRAEPEQVEQLLTLGEAMREAQESLAGAELRELRVQQHKVVDAMRVQATRLVREAGGRLSSDAGEQVISTLRAGMTDPAAADAVRSGRLVRVLEATGFGGVDVSDAVAGDGPTTPAARPARPARTAAASAPATPRRSSAPKPPPDELRARREEKERREAERRAAEAERREREERERQEALEQAREELADAEHAAEEAAAEATSAATREQDLERRHADLLAQAETVAEQLEAARGTLRAAERGAHAAQERADRARRAAEELESS